jgi:hypothetical protein
MSPPLAEDVPQVFIYLFIFFTINPVISAFRFQRMQMYLLLHRLKVPTKWKTLMHNPFSELDWQFILSLVVFIYPFDDASVSISCGSLIELSQVETAYLLCASYYHRLEFKCNLKKHSSVRFSWVWVDKALTIQFHVMNIHTTMV